jgi:hypothetical protein
MPGTRQQLVAIAFAWVCVAAPAAAHAFHNGSVFDRAPGAGGGGGLFYTGARRERGWDCTACHVEPRGRLRVDVSSQPPELIADGRFRAGAAYAITIAMRDPQGQLGLGSTRSNYNGIAVSVVDEGGVPAGTIGGFDPGRFYARGTSILASDSTVNNETSWSFTWTAPADASGSITIHLGVVDGNGAGVAGASTLTDPLGDDVAVHAFVARGDASAAAGRGHSTWAALALALIVVCGRRPHRGGRGGVEPHGPQAPGAGTPSKK